MKKTLVSFFAVTLLVLSGLFCSSVDAVEVPGYQAISTKEDFYNIRNDTDGKYYLTNDIVFTELDYTVMGNYYNGFHAFDYFYGVLDGCGHSITGLISEHGVVKFNNGTIKNLEFIDCTFADSGMVNENYGTISNCKISNSTIGDANRYNKSGISGFANVNDDAGIIEYCSTSACTINGSAGIAGRNEGTINFCTNYSDIIHSYSVGAAGIVEINYGTVSNCVNLGAIEMSGGSAAGISLDNSKGIILNCVNRANITTKAGSSEAAGITCAMYTANSSAYIRNCLNSGNILNQKSTGAAFGIATSDAGQSLYCVNTGKVTSRNADGYAITRNESEQYACYYLSGTGIAPGTAFAQAQLDANTFAGFDFDEVWAIGNDGLSLICEKEFQSEITAYQYAAKTKYWRGNALDLSDMVVFSLNSRGTWYELYDDEYSVNGYNSEKLGKQTVTVNSEDDSFSFNVYVYDNIGNQTIKVSPSTFEYSGQNCKPSVAITDVVTKQRLTVGKDYKIAYGNNLNVGTAYVSITGLGYYDGTYKREFEIIPKDISEATVSAIPSSITYTGSAVKPSVKVTIEGVELVNNRDFTVSYKNNVNAGTATAVVKGIGNYKGTTQIKFKILPVNVSKCKVKLSTSTYTYNGSAKTPSVSATYGSRTLKKNTDFTVTYASGRKNAGTYKVTVKMKGNYTGTKTLTFKINPISVSKCKLSLSATTYTYDGKTKTPSVVVKDAAGKTLKKNTDYTVSYASGRKNVGTYTVTVKMKGNYSGTKKLTYKINPVSTAVSKLTAGKKSITVAITKKSTQVTGYQIQYSTSKTFSNATAKTISSYKTTNYTLKSLSAKKTYYVRVRTYKTVGETKYYSGWSTYKYVKTK